MLLRLIGDCRAIIVTYVTFSSSHMRLEFLPGPPFPPNPMGRPMRRAPVTHAGALSLRCAERPRCKQPLQSGPAITDR
jgi:hypothetical protein